jgi:hypothetical protein
MPGMSLSIVCADTEPNSIQISDDGDHVGTVQYSLTESSCVEVNNLSTRILKDKQSSNRSHVLCDGLDCILDVAQLSEEQKNQSHDFSKKCHQTSFTLMAASRAPAVQLTGCGDRDNIGRGESGLKVASRKGHEETRQLFFYGLCRCVTNASNARDHSDRSRAALVRFVLPRMFPHLGSHSLRSVP